MRTSYILLLLTVTGIGAPATAQFTEIDVTVAEGVAGKVVSPEEGESAPTGTVLLLHGWTGKMDEAGDL